MNMNLIAIVTPPSIYHGCSSKKTFWEEIFTLGEFTPVNKNIYGRQNVNKNIYIRDSVKYITLDTLLEFVSMDKTRITSSETKDNLARSGKKLITSLGLNNNVRSKKHKKAGYTITDVSMKDLSNITRGLKNHHISFVLEVNLHF